MITQKESVVEVWKLVDMTKNPYISNIGTFYKLRKKYRKETEELTADTEEDCLYNTFWIYLAGISELLLIVMLQGELNYISIPCLIAAGIVLGVCAYRVGQNSKEKDK